MTSVMSAFMDGIRRTRHAPLLIAGIWLVTVLLSLPLALAVREAVVADLGASLEAQALADGADYDWLQAFRDQSSGVATTLTPDVIGGAAVLENASSFLDRRARPLLVFAAIIVQVAALTFLAGGCIDRLARNRPVPAHAFFGACGVFFPRFLRLAIASGVVYSVLFGPYFEWIFSTIAPKLTRNATAERTAFIVHLGGYLAWLVPLAATTLIFDYAKVRAVVEDRRSMIAAIFASAGFLRRHPGALALYALDGLLLLAIIGAYAVIAPGAGGAGPSMWSGFILGQIYIAARGWTKLLLWSSEVAFFQSRLAHAGYVRRRLPKWPESPAAEAIGHTSANL